MIPFLEDKYQDYIDGPYMVDVEECDKCGEKRIVLVLRDVIQYKIDSENTVTRRIRFCILCMRSILTNF